MNSVRPGNEKHAGLKPRVVVLGVGFGGLRVARALGGKPVDVTLIELIGFRNRLAVLIDWCWSYLFYERAVRLIGPS